MNTLGETLRQGRQYLEECGIDNGRAEAWFLLEFVCGIDRNYYFLHTNDIIGTEQAQRYEELVKKRGERIPLQQLTHTAHFMGLSFHVNEHVLIPRQDTEVLVEAVLEQLPPQSRVLDLCTGSGCILISLMKYGQDIRGTGADISRKALEVARENARRHGVAAEFTESDLFSGVTGTFSVIVSNPPYIPSAVIPTLMEEVRLHEPLLALDGREDGLYFYRRIVREAGHYLEPGGYLAFEIGHDQGEALRQLLEEAGYDRIVIKQDLAGLDRVAAARKPF